MLPLLAMFSAGALLSIQAGVNARLRVTLGSPLWAALGSFFVGMVALVAVCLAARLPWPDARRIAAAPAWIWIGGLFGATYLTLSAAFATRLGATALIAAVVSGQLVCSVVLDHFGWAGFSVQRLTATRAIGVLLLGVGAALVRSR
jgi:transporter family-2 protein